MDLSINYCPILKGTLDVPASKSHAQRVLALSFLVDKIHIKGLGHSADEIAVKNIISQCGSTIREFSENEIEVKNAFNFDRDIELNCGESGLASRLFSAFFLLNIGETKIIGSGSLMNRPMTPLKAIYEQLGVKYEWNEEKLPLIFRGNNVAKNLEIDGSLSSQFITGLLYFIVGMQSSETIFLKINHPQSIPYIDLTISVLSLINANIKWVNQDTLAIHPSVLKKEITVEIERDWSSASFWIVAAAIRGDITLRGLNINSHQADKKILDVVREFGADISFPDKDGIRIQSNHRNSFYFDATHCPDLIPILAILAIFANGTSTIVGTERLIHKESNRIDGINSILKKVQVESFYLINFIKIIGNENNFTRFLTLDSLSFKGYNDHRIVMASSILALYLLKGEIEGIEAIDKSYPNFFQDMTLLGASIKIIN